MYELKMNEIEMVSGADAVGYAATGGLALGSFGGSVGTMAGLMNGAMTGAKWGRIGGLAGMAGGAILGATYYLLKAR